MMPKKVIQIINELEVMLAGKKPIAVIQDVYPNKIGDDLYNNQLFERYVADGAGREAVCL
ncbi:MAG: hypothetical protein HKN14_12765 [Marinicaulis sp.]|nr:hypothetical protein [Marinicaulis sp.]NNE41776.1 hypothetical protein [Marinicaulis sp.]NNL89402.1 hypothetical protein [Marinicaulis sp.]